MQLDLVTNFVNNEIHFPINEYYIWLYILGFYYLIVLIVENFKGGLCYFLNESYLGIKNIFITIVIFISPFTQPLTVKYLSQLGFSEVVIKATEVGYVALEIVFVIIAGYYYLFVFILGALFFAIIYSVLGLILGSILKDIGIIIATVIMGRWYGPFVLDFIRSLLSFPLEFVNCIKESLFNE